MLERLNGMFAIVIADTRRGAVHLLRDRCRHQAVVLGAVRNDSAVCVGGEGVSGASGVLRRDRPDSGRRAAGVPLRCRPGLAAKRRASVQPGHRLHNHAGGVTVAATGHPRSPREDASVTGRRGRSPRSSARPQRAVAIAERRQASAASYPVASTRPWSRCWRGHTAVPI